MPYDSSTGRLDDDGEPAGTFEVFQQIKDKPLTRHPETGQPVERLITPPFIGGQWSEHRCTRASPTTRSWKSRVSPST